MEQRGVDEGQFLGMPAYRRILVGMYCVVAVVGVAFGVEDGLRHIRGDSSAVWAAVLNEVLRRGALSSALFGLAIAGWALHLMACIVVFDRVPAWATRRYGAATYLVLIILLTSEEYRRLIR